MSNLKSKPIACSLTNEESRDREAELLTRFKAAGMETEELQQGFAFRLPGDANLIQLVAELIVLSASVAPS